MGTERVLRGSGEAVFRWVVDVLTAAGFASPIRTSTSQVAFRCRRGFAYLWMPGRYLTKPAAEVVLSIALDRHLESARFKQEAHPAPSVWMHHLEIHALADLDDEVEGWLREAADRAT